MKMGKPRRVPLSAPAFDIVRAQYEIRGRNHHVFPWVVRSSSCP